MTREVMPTHPAVSSIGLARRFGAVRALDGFDLEILEGEILGLVGPNGAGKTTFIRVVAGLLAPDAGRIEVLGRTPGRATAAEVGYMTQSPALYEDLSLRENLAFFGRVYGLSRAGVAERAGELVSLVHLEDDEDRPVRQLSGGQRQLANLACAMVHGPSLLLLDEPTVGIDPVLRRSLWGRFGALRDAGTTILVTTHVMEEATRCDRVAFVNAGAVLTVGTPEQVSAPGGGSIEDAFLAFRDGRAEPA
jgi:ABC-2 type transport system ATP-binding protein